jgi:hypothetical protein
MPADGRPQVPAFGRGIWISGSTGQEIPISGVNFFGNDVSS